MELKHKGERICEKWLKRRGPAASILPSWIIKTYDGQPIRLKHNTTIDHSKVVLILDEAKAIIIRRIFRDILLLGAARLAAKLNGEGVPNISGRKPSHRDELIWDGGSFSRLIRGRQVLGEQEVCHMQDNKRVRKGQFEKAYPAVVTEAEWQAANSALDGRKSGPGNGRNTERYTNLFGDLGAVRQMRRPDEGPAERHRRTVLLSRLRQRPCRYVRCEEVSPARSCRADHPAAHRRRDRYRLTSRSIRHPSKRRSSKRDPRPKRSKRRTSDR